MKTIDFNNNPTNESKQPEQVNEFLTLIAAGALAYVCSITLMQATNFSLGKMAEIRSQLEKLGLVKSAEEKQREKDEKARRKAEKKEKKRQEKEQKKAEKEAEREKKRLEKEEAKQRKNAKKNILKATKQMLTLEDTINKLPDGEHKDELGEKLAAFNRMMNGEATKEDYDMIEKESNRDLSDKEKKELTSNSLQVLKISDEEAEKAMKDKGYSLENLSKSASTAGVIEKPLEGIDDEPDGDESDDTDDNDKDTDKDTKKEEPKEEIKDMEVEDPETGKKVMRKVHIGPQGGKYYWPDGAPHDAEHKVYVKK